MQRLRRIRYRIGAVVALIGISVLVAACGSSSATTAAAGAGAAGRRRGQLDGRRQCDRGAGGGHGHGRQQHPWREGDVLDRRPRPRPVSVGGRRQGHVELLGRLRPGLAAADDDV